MPPDTVNCARPGTWGNPFVVGREYVLNATVAVQSYRAWIDARMRSDRDFCHTVAGLRGKNLACWCRLGEPCHADVLLELANA